MKILKNKLYLLNPSLAITLKQKGQPIIAYGTELLQSPMQGMHILSKDYEIIGPPVEQIVSNSYVKETHQSLENSKEKTKNKN